MNDYIEIIDDEGHEKTYELVSTFKIEGYSSNYVVYKNIDDEKYYIGKYNGLSISELDTNLNNEEIELAKTIFDGERN